MFTTVLELEVSNRIETEISQLMTLGVDANVSLHTHVYRLKLTLDLRLSAYFSMSVLDLNKLCLLAI